MNAIDEIDQGESKVLEAINAIREVLAQDRPDLDMEVVGRGHR